MYPVHDIDEPAVLSGLSNGKLPGTVLTVIDGQPDLRFVDVAARAFRALAAACPYSLAATSYYDSYRPYDVQVTLFKQRWTTDPQPNITGMETVHWDGSLWWRRIGDDGKVLARAAVPGTSNHGRGLAIDIANAGGARLDWLLANAMRFGWSWELQSEPWHLHFWAGDNMPAAVLDWENSMDEASIATAVWAKVIGSASLGDKAAQEFLKQGQIAVQEARAAKDAVAALAVKVDAIPTTSVPSEPAQVDIPSLAAALIPLLQPMVEEAVRVAINNTRLANP